MNRKFAWLVTPLLLVDHLADAQLATKYLGAGSIFQPSQCEGDHE
jgi:hypothetical protein